MESARFVGRLCRCLLLPYTVPWELGKVPVASLCHQIVNTFAQVVHTLMHVPHPLLEDRTGITCGLCVTQSFSEVGRPRHAASIYSVRPEDRMLICPYSSFTFASTQSANYDKSSFQKMREINPPGGLRAAGMSPCNKRGATWRGFPAQTSCALFCRFLSS